MEKLLILKLWTGLAARPPKEMKGERKGADPKKKNDKDESGNRNKSGKDGGGADFDTYSRDDGSLSGSGEPAPGGAAGVDIHYWVDINVNLVARRRFAKSRKRTVISRMCFRDSSSIVFTAFILLSLSSLSQRQLLEHIPRTPTEALRSRVNNIWLSAMSHLLRSPLKSAVSSSERFADEEEGSVSEFSDEFDVRTIPFPLLCP